jgi:Holliday junction DNA helicase RuvA
MMITFLSGILTHKRDNKAIIDVNGVGFGVVIPVSTYRVLPKAGEPVTIFTKLILREDDISLYGFGTEEERQMFEILLLISGVGAKMAIDILSHLPVFRLVQAAQNEEIALLTQVPGIGKKRAEKLLFDLKRQKHPLLLAPVKPGGDEESAPEPAAQSETGREVAEALLALGCKPQEAHTASDKALKALGESAPIQDLIREALKHR